MGFATLDRMKDALLSVPVSPLERIILLDMAVAVADDSPAYTWGHERLARALGRQPGQKATKSALERVLSGLTARGLLVRTADAHRGRHAEYSLAVLTLEGPRSDRGPFGADPAEKGPRSGGGWAPVSDLKGPGLSGAPLPESPPVSLTRNSAERADARIQRMTDAQRRNVSDALEAIAARCDAVDVLASRTAELAYLDRLTSSARRPRIAAWAGLRSHAEQPGGDLEYDPRLHDLLAAHGHVCDDCTDPWTTYQEETA